MAATRKVSNAAVAVAVVVVAMLVMATAAQDCGVNRNQVMTSCLAYCKYGSMLNQCCGALKGANTKCLCDTYWKQLQKSSYASCASKIDSECGIGC